MLNLVKNNIKYVFTFYSELFLCAIVSSFDASTVVDKTLNILDLIQANEEDMGMYFEKLPFCIGT